MLLRIHNKLPSEVVNVTATMRRGFSLAGLAFGGILGTSYAALEAVTGVTASANGWDPRPNGFGCAPDGCVPANVLNASIDDDSRWSCLPSRSLIDVCELTFTFDEPQDIFEMRLAMWKGNRRSRTLNVWVDGVLSATVETSAITLEYEAYELSATQASVIVLQGAGPEEDVWISITGVQLMAEGEPEVFPPGLAPTSEDYLGCFNDDVTDRVLTTVVTDDAMTLEDCAAKCGEMVKFYYGLLQGNECWCAGCEITERETNTDFDRHGDGTCNTPCAGDPSSVCGGDMAISLYQSNTCLATPAPTPSIPPSECPGGSAQASLHITASWDASSPNFQLHIIEPGGVEVSEHYNFQQIGDVGMVVEGVRHSYPYDESDPEPESDAYLTLNGLNVADDAVLGDYEIWGTGREGTVWTITARSGGELLWVAGGEFSEFQTETERLIATVTSYAESDCSVDTYDKCPANAISPDGFPPCSKCPLGVVSRGGTTFCTDPALRNLGVSETIANAIIADAVGGWAGPGYANLYDGDRYFYPISVGGEESGTITLSGNYEKDDDADLAASTALFLYVHDENSESDFVRGQGEIDPSSGNFTATFTGLPVGASKAVLSFVVLDPADAGEGNRPYDTAFAADVVNEGCSDALRIRLEWDESEYDFELWVTDPNGDRVNYYTQTTDLAYINNPTRGGRRVKTPEAGLTGSFKEYVVFSGLTGSAMLGEYRIFTRSYDTTTAWKITATVNGVVEWIEEGTLAEHTDDDGGSSSRRLFTSYSDDDTTTSSYSGSYYPQSDTFTVTLDSYDPAGC